MEEEGGFQWLNMAAEKGAQESWTDIVGLF